MSIELFDFPFGGGDEEDYLTSVSQCSSFPKMMNRSAKQCLF